MQGSLLVASLLSNIFVPVGQGGGVTSSLGFYHLVSEASELCSGVNGPTPSIAGWIGLEGDTDSNPKRSFFWYVCTLIVKERSDIDTIEYFHRYFHAESNPDDAPIM